MASPRFFLPVPHPVSLSLSPRCSVGLPGSNSARWSSTAGFIYRSIFSLSRAQLFLTNMSSSTTGLIQWEERQRTGRPSNGREREEPRGRDIGETSKCSEGGDGDRPLTLPLCSAPRTTSPAHFKANSRPRQATHYLSEGSILRR